MFKKTKPFYILIGLVFLFLMYSLISKLIVNLGHGIEDVATHKVEGNSVGRIVEPLRDSNSPAPINKYKGEKLPSLRIIENPNYKGEFTIDMNINPTSMEKYLCIYRYLASDGSINEKVVPITTCQKNAKY